MLVIKLATFESYDDNNDSDDNGNGDNGNNDNNNDSSDDNGNDDKYWIFLQLCKVFDQVQCFFIVLTMMMGISWITSRYNYYFSLIIIMLHCLLQYIFIIA